MFCGYTALLIAQFEMDFHPLKQLPLCSTLSSFKQHVEKVMQQSVQFHGLLKTPAPNEMKKRFFFFLSLRNGVRSCYCMVGEHIIGMGWLLGKKKTYTAGQTV